MPLDSNVRGLSALAGLGLLLTAFVCAYLNATTAAFLWSMIYVGAVVITSLAAASKLATALGVENGLAQAADYVSSIVPWMALYFLGIQALHFQHDGLDGFMAGVAIISLVFTLSFGVMDSVKTFVGGKYAALSEATREAQRRAAAISEAASGRR